MRRSRPIWRDPVWLMLLTLIAGFALSQAFRTVGAIMATPLQREFAVSAQGLGLFAGAYHFAFGALQLAMGIGIDLYGVRRTMLAAFPLAIAGAALSAAAPNFALLVLGQVLIGIGCAPAFLACTVFIARHFPAARFAAMSGLALGMGSTGLLLTGTPLAWLIEHSSWRAGFVALGIASSLAWLVIWWRGRERESGDSARTPVEATARPWTAALQSYGDLFRLPHTLGIVALSAVTYASFISLRGLWLGPLLIERHGFSLVQSGNVALVVSIVGILGPPFFGRLDPGATRRRRWIMAFTLITAAIFAAMAFDPDVAVDIGGAMATAFLSGFIVLQYTDVRAAYPAAMTGRAMALFTMAMFLGVAGMQWLTGAVATAAAALGADPFMGVLGCIALLLALGALAFYKLPGPSNQAN
ncbi:MAG: MFS transporter [Variovorax sp.]